MILTIFYALVGTLAVGILYDLADTSTDDTQTDPDTSETPETPEAPETPASIETVTGTTGSDTLSAADDQIAFGGDGADVMSASGNGIVVGGAGADTLSAAGLGEARGGTGADVLTGAGASTVSGGFGSDTLTLTDDAFGEGEEGSDTLIANGTALAKGDAGSDILQLSEEAVGRGGLDDDLLAADGDSTALGNAGNDTLLGMGGAELEGGDGDDILAYQGTAIDSGASVTATGGEGADTFVIGLTGSEGALPDWNALQGLPSLAGNVFEITDFNAEEDRVLIDAFDEIDGELSVITEMSTVSDETGTALNVLLTATNGAEQTVGSLTLRFTNINPEDFDPLVHLGFVTSSEEALATDTPETFAGPLTTQTLTDGDDAAVITAATLLDAGAGNDTITWTAGIGGTANLGDGNDTIVAGPANVIIDGGAGDDVITAACGATIDPGTGTDAITLNLEAGTAPIAVAFSEEADTITVNLAANTAVDYFQVTVVETDTVTDATSGDPVSFTQTGTVYFLSKTAGLGLTEEGFLADFGGATVLAEIDLGVKTGVSASGGGLDITDAFNDTVGITVNGTLAGSFNFPITTTATEATA